MSRVPFGATRLAVLSSLLGKAVMATLAILAEMSPDRDAFGVRTPTRQLPLTVGGGAKQVLIHRENTRHCASARGDAL